MKDTKYGPKPIAGLKIRITRSIYGDCAPIPFFTLNQASAAYRAFIERHGLGGSEAGQCLIMNGSKVVANVAYNGRIFEGAPDEWTPSTKQLFPEEAVCAS